MTALYSPKTTSCQGFSLLELLIALVCISVLASWAWPSYQALVLSAQRAQARTALLQAAHWLERAAGANGSYPLPSDIPSSVLQTQGQRYTITVNSTAQSFTLNATPIGAQAADPCGTLTLNHLGVRGVLGGSQAAAPCWSR